MATPGDDSLAARITALDARDNQARTVLWDDIRALRYQVHQAPALDLLGHLDTALQLVGMLDRTVGTDPEHIIQCVADLVGTVESEIAARGAPGNHPAPGNLDHLGETGLRALREMVLGEILAQLEVVSPEQVDAAMRIQNRKPVLIGEALVEMGAATEAQIEEAMRIQTRLRDTVGVPGDLFSAIVPCHQLWNHGFLKRARQGRVSAAQIKVLATQMYKFCREFNRILAAALVRCPDEQARVVIAANLFDELGNGDPQKTHPELFRRFTRALGISDEELAATPAEPETQHLIDTYLGLSDRYGYVAALGAICYASENIVATLYRILLSGIEKGVRVAPEDLVFFHAHVELDCEHADALINVVNDGVHNIATAKKVVHAIRDALAARVRFFDGIERSAGG